MLLTIASLALTLGGADTPPVPLLGGVTPDRVAAATRPSRSVHASSIRRAATIPPRLRPWAACVLRRESGGTLADPTSGMGARNESSSASGRWQFLDSQWRRGLSYMVADRLRDHGVPRPTARVIRLHLAATPIHRWPAPYQDAGFVEVVERGGAFHWRGPGCGMPR